MGGYSGEMLPKRKRVRVERFAAALGDKFEQVEVGDWTISSIGRGVSIVSYAGEEEDLVVPSSFDDRPVIAIGERAFCNNQHIQLLEIPDSVRSIGSRAFARCRKLESIKFPAHMHTLDGSVLDQCAALRDVSLPDDLESLPSRLLDALKVEHLTIPAGLVKLEDRSYNPKSLTSIAVDAGNKRFTTDGLALYESAEDGGSILFRLMCDVGEYALAEDCVSVADSACKNLRGLKAVSLPEGLVETGSYSFFGTGLNALCIPDSCKTIGPHSFQNCTSLQEVHLGNSVKSIEDYAFMGDPLTSIQIPASVRFISRRAFDGKVVDSGGACFSVDSENPKLFSYGGALYKYAKAGLTLVGCLGDMEEVVVHEDTIEILDSAFASSEHLLKVTLPEGLQAIGDKAFFACIRLRSINIPDSVETIGKEAFWETKLTTFHLGSSLRYLGEDALMVSGLKRKTNGRTLKSVTVAPENDLFYVENDLLIQRRNQGDLVLLFLGNTEDVVIPKQVTGLADKAFYAMYVRSLTVHCSVRDTPGPRTFLAIAGLEHVTVIFSEAGFEYDQITLYFPGYQYDMDRYAPILKATPFGFFNFPEYDQWICAIGDQVLFCHMALARLETPFCLDEPKKKRFEWGIGQYMWQLMRHHVAIHDVQILTRLDKLGLLTEDAVKIAFDEASKEGETAFKAQLLEKMNARSGGMAEEDFSL